MSSGNLRLIAAADAGEGGDPSTLDVRDDDDLMLLARGGMTSAFDVLVRRYQQRALRLATRQLGRVAPAPDVAQNAFLAIYRALSRYQPRGRFAAYLFRTVLNECRMARRSDRVRRRVAAIPDGGVDWQQQTAVATSASAEAQVLAREQERDVQAAVSRLSDKLRDVVSLRYGAGLGYDEVAETLRIPVGTVKRRLFDALEKLRGQMQELP
jgi:RNA polymerase sigma-70 factor (ECF subfamily)